ncbi:hypothetical protein LB535_27185 [Mesorhizobium sp. CA10]|uniref:hypothetical protein n=1 Tax=Mesorhizobium sp. CA10 TaxID=588495 RepID=UPI001CCBC7F6|nr:hypothetical protein [Mesorhizobium sp. CA10]MBZ9886027.1 hypothetical protein [Mesorhizobium sp. CA10]
MAERCFGDKISTAEWRSRRNWYVVEAQDETIAPAMRVVEKREGSDTNLAGREHPPRSDASNGRGYRIADVLRAAGCSEAVAKAVERSPKGEAVGREELAGKGWLPGILRSAVTEAPDSLAMAAE